MTTHLITDKEGAATLAPLLLTVEEAALLTRISRSKLYELMQRNEIPSITIGRSRRIPREALIAWIARRAAVADQPF
jgi:excisionase family DNA binding protein